MYPKIVLSLFVVRRLLVLLVMTIIFLFLCTFSIVSVLLKYLVLT